MSNSIKVELVVTTPEFANHLENKGCAAARIFEINNRDDLIEATKKILKLMEDKEQG